MNNYEKSQYEAIKKWKSEKPSVVSQAVASVFKPASWLIEKIIPSKAIEGVLSGCNMMAEWFCDIDDIKRDAKVVSISELKTKDLELSDKLANEVHNWAVAAATGAEATGVASAVALRSAVEIIPPRPVPMISLPAATYSFLAAAETVLPSAISFLSSFINFVFQIKLYILKAVTTIRRAQAT